MSRSSAKFVRHLRSEIADWQQEGLVDESLAKTLRERYREPPSRFNLTVLATIFGAILVGAGTLLFVAANWDQMSSLLKVALIVATIVATNFFGWRLRFEPGGQPRLGTALFIIGSFMYGGGIWLIGQIFNIDTAMDSGLLLWAAGTAATAVTTRLPSLSIMSIILGGGWLVTGNVDLFIAAIAFGLGVMMAARSRSPLAATWTLISGFLWVALHYASGGIGIIAYGMSSFAAHLLVQKRWPFMEAAFKYFGVIFAMLGYLLLTMNLPASSSHGDFIGPVFITLLFLGASLLKMKAESRPLLYTLMLILIGSLSLLAMQSSQIEKIFSCVLYLAVTCGLMFLGIRERSPGLVNCAVVFFSLFIVVRYFDTFFMALDRSVFFLVGGVILLIGGSIAERSRRKLLEGLQS